MRSQIYTFSLCSLFFILTSCSFRQYQSFFVQKSTASDTLSKKDIYTGPYRIRPEDQLQIRNLQNIKYIVDETPPTVVGAGGAGGAGQIYQVEEDGTVALPVIGHLTVAGLTKVQATKLIEGEYRKNVLKDPIIELKIINLKVTLLGEVKGTGNFPLIKDKTTLVEMLGTAGGLTDRANETNIKIIRGDQKIPQVTVINLRDIESINDPRAVLQNGDIIYVTQNKRAVRNDNLQNISSLVQPMLLLFNTALIILSFSRR